MTDPDAITAGLLPHIRDALADGTPRNTHAVAAAVDQALGPDRAVSTPAVAAAIEHLAADGVVEHTDAGWTLTSPGPDLHGDNLRDTPREALAAAWAAAPKNGTIEAKARQAHEWLTGHGWDVVDVREGPPVVLGPDEQVVTVPDGWEVDVRPEDPVTYTPGDQLVDPELSELAEIVARLEGLDPESRERVAAFVTHRYGPVTPVPVGRPSWLDVTRPPGHDLPLRTGGVIGRPQATRISE